MNTSIRTILFIAILGFLCVSKVDVTQGQSQVAWSNFVNISKTFTASSYPAMVADTSGKVHVVWSEDVGGETQALVFRPDGSPRLDRRGRQVNFLWDLGNTLFYSSWDGNTWSTPVDIYTALDSKVTYPQVVVDAKGTIHLAWIQSQNEIVDLMYSQAPVEQAASVRAWTDPVILASQLSPDYYPVGLAVDQADELHILYYKYGQNPGVFVINSTDGGNIWSDPIQIYANNDPYGREDGSLPVRITSDEKNRLHAMWKVYGEDGNGKYIYYSQSVDQGKTWSTPFLMAEKQPGWYEVDWLNIGIVGDQIHAVWEGGVLAYQNERISNDGGKTWEPAQRILPMLVGENGWQEFVTDSQGILHQFVAKRTGVGDATVYALWHSQYRNDQWTTPDIVGLENNQTYHFSIDYSPDEIDNMLKGTIMMDGLRYPRSVVINGNEIVVIIVNEYDGEIYASHAVVNAPEIPPVPYPTAESVQIEQPVNTPLPEVETTQAVIIEKQPGRSPVSPGTLVMASLVPVFLLVLGVVIYKRTAHRG